MKLRLSITPKFCGPVSIGTGDLIKVIRDRCGYELVRAKGYVDRAIFDGEVVEIPLPDEVDGQSVLDEIRGLETPAKISVELLD